MSQVTLDSIHKALDLAPSGYDGETVDDVREWFTALVVDCRIAFHPDDDLGEVVDVRTGKPLFLRSESQRLSEGLDDAFEICDRNGVDIYQLTLDVTNEALARGDVK